MSLYWYLQTDGVKLYYTWTIGKVRSTQTIGQSKSITFHDKTKHCDTSQPYS